MLETLRGHVYRFLRKSERYAKTDMVYLTKGSFWLTLSHAAALFSGLALAIAFAHFLPPDTFGIYKYVLSLTGILAAFSLTGLTTSLTRAVAQGATHTLRSSFGTNVRWSFFGSVLGLVAAGYYFINGNTILGASLVIFSITFPIYNSALLYGAFLEGKRDFRRLSLYNSLRVSSTTVAFITILLFSDNPLYIVGAYFLLETLLSVTFYYLTIRKPSDEETDVKPISETDTVNYGKHLSFMNLLSIGASHLDKVLVFHYLGAAQLAIYAFAIAPVTQLSSLSKIVKSLAYPKLSTTSLETLKKTLWHKIALFFLTTLGATIAYIFAAPYIYQFLFPQYVESVHYSQLYALMLLFAPHVLLAQTLISHRMQRELYFIKLTVPTFKIFCLFILLPFIGIWGAVASELLALAFSSLLLIYAFRRI